MLRGVAATKSSVPLLRMLQLIRFPGGLIPRLPPLLSWLGAFRGAWEADKILPFSGRMTSPKILFLFFLTGRTVRRVPGEGQNRDPYPRKGSGLLEY